MQRRGYLSPAARVLAVCACLVLFAGCSREQQAGGQRPMPEVSTVTVAPREVALSTELSGRTSAYRIAEIRPRVNGLVEKRLFTEGSNVKEGQVLYQIDPAPFTAELDNAQAALAEAKAKLPTTSLRASRYKALVSHSALSQQDYDDAASNLDQVKASITSLEARVETARINLGYTKVVAPISGRIGKSSVTDGAIVTAYQATALATIQQLDPIYVDVPQSTADMLRMKARFKEGLLNPQEKDHDKVRLILEDGKPYPLEGTLQFSDVSVDPTTGSVILRLIFPNPEGDILPGMFVKAVIREGVNPKAILVPQQGVSRDAKGNPYALLVDAENKVVLRQLTLDRAIGSEWLVADGLVPGDRVIVEGLQMLRPGTVVKATSLAQGDPKSAGEGHAEAKPAKQAAEGK
ncbi:efflux RND transporter periplasmic adaptor subunit [Solidesulfovibrio sp.]|uniref:efflux RND transporter periplasmic adaptor subunit n=1 Tax=Solidesulfovibrio sp. TaxID=2910990 RepID=UPI002B204187|nr:efflux RND transporter periplasmic adaptor subunit [Solidesulfovibrio sp.]MEA5090176.1 efflux RND transporter periplasmic adaptor subunit [Solidesulfovibrio sp.]